MTAATHISASASHYDQEAAHYDAFNEAKSLHINQQIEAILNDHGVHNVLDLACGTGSQVLHLVSLGYVVTGVDINAQMLSLAQQKVKQVGLPCRLEQGDMRTSQLGQFDAVLTIFNAIGHLTAADFEQAVHNIAANLKSNGLYIFDIFNLDYLLHEDNITQLTIDWQKKKGDTTVREIQYSTISPAGVLASYDIYHEQIGDHLPTITTAYQTLQVYSASQLTELLHRCGFQVIQKTAIDGSPLKPQETDRLLIVAKKV